MGWVFSPRTSLLRSDALDGCAKLSHDAAISGRVPRGSWSGTAGPGGAALAFGRRGAAAFTVRLGLRESEEAREEEDEEANKRVYFFSDDQSTVEDPGRPLLN